MLKKYFVFFLIIFYSGCGKTQDENKIKEEIVKHKKEIVELKSKISELEKKLKKNSRNNTNNGILVSVLEVKQEKFEHFFTINGTVEAVQEAFISPELSGQIKKIYVKEGDRVKKG